MISKSLGSCPHEDVVPPNAAYRASLEAELSDPEVWSRSVLGDLEAAQDKSPSARTVLLDRYYLIFSQ